MNEANWLVFVVPTLNLFLLLGGIARLVWHAGKLEQSVGNLHDWQRHVAREVDEVAKELRAATTEIARIKGVLNLNGGQAPSRE